MAPHIPNGHGGMIGGPPKSHAPLAEAPTSQDLCRFCLSAGFTTSVWDEQAPHHTTKVMMAPHIANGHDGMIGGPPKSHAPLAEAPTSQDLCRFCLSAGFTTSVWDEQAPHHTTKVMMAPHIANGHDGMIGGPPKSHAPLAEAPTSQDLCRFCLSAGFTTSVWDEQAPHHTTKVMMAPHIANGHGGMIGGPPKSHAPLAEAPTSQDLCRFCLSAGFTTSVGIACSARLVMLMIGWVVVMCIRPMWRGHPRVVLPWSCQGALSKAKA